MPRICPFKICHGKEGYLLWNLTHMMGQILNGALGTDLRNCVRIEGCLVWLNIVLNIELNSIFFILRHDHICHVTFKWTDVSNLNEFVSTLYWQQEFIVAVVDFMWVESLVFIDTFPSLNIPHEISWWSSSMLTLLYQYGSSKFKGIWFLFW